MHQRLSSKSGPVGVALLMATSIAVAAPVAKSDMTIDWSSFSVTAMSSGSDPLPVLTWSTMSSVVNAYTPQAQTAMDWTTPLTMQVPGVGFFSESNATAVALHSYSEDMDTSGSTSGGIWTLRQGEFDVAGAGSVVFSVNYVWSVTLQPPVESPLSFAYAFASMLAETRNDPRGGGNRSGDDQSDIQYFSSFPSDIGSFQGQGTLTFEVPVLDGDHFYFTASSSSTANITASPVPMPAAAWLFTWGLVGVLGASRVRRNAPVTSRRG